MGVISNSEYSNRESGYIRHVCYVFHNEQPFDQFNTSQAAFALSVIH